LSVKRGTWTIGNPISQVLYELSQVVDSSKLKLEVALTPLEPPSCKDGGSFCFLFAFFLLSLQDGGSSGVKATSNLSKESNHDRSDTTQKLK
jgi:hypothetical protein